MRVIAGKLGGRRLVAPKGARTRPTLERVRQALFDVLGAKLEGANVLDLFAGTGALGIEALSRGARHSVFVESDRHALEALQKNVAALGLSTRAVIVPSKLEQAGLRLRAHGPFDVVFCDPPWSEVARAVAGLAGWLTFGPDKVEQSAMELLAPVGIVVLEHSAREPIESLPGLAVELESRRIWGDTAVSIFKASAYVAPSEGRS